MNFVRDFLRNLGLLIGLGLVIYVLFPDTMRQVVQIYGGLFGPVAIIFLAAAALPRKKQH